MGLFANGGHWERDHNMARLLNIGLIPDCLQDSNVCLSSCLISVCHMAINDCSKHLKKAGTTREEYHVMRFLSCSCSTSTEQG